jgi:hypothetical protein
MERSGEGSIVKKQESKRGALGINKSDKLHRELQRRTPVLHQSNAKA